MGKTVFLAFIGRGHAGLLKGKANPNATPGKETPFIKSLGRRIQEEEFNEPVAAMVREHLKRCGVHVYDPAPGEKDVPLKERTDFANKIYWQYCRDYGTENVVAVYVSIHFNAFDASFDGPNPSGFSVHIYPGSANGRKLGNAILNELKNGTKQINRGIVEQNLHVTREAKMPAALSENGFMDHPEEALLMLDKGFQNEVAEEHAKGICKYFDIPFITQPPLKVANEKNENEGDDWLMEPLKLPNREMENALLRVLTRFEKKDPALAEVWRNKFLAGELTGADAIGLVFVAFDRSYIVGTKE